MKSPLRSLHGILKHPLIGWGKAALLSMRGDEAAGARVQRTVRIMKEFSWGIHGGFTMNPPGYMGT
jgi:hypothetical protein